MTPILQHQQNAFIVRRWCVRLALALLILGTLSNALYLWNHCPLDLSEDESHYWEWARNLDYGYYSKPPGIAWVLWLATRLAAFLGRNASGAALMPVLRMPAVLFAFLSGLLSFLLARRIFRDDRAGLAVILLSAAVPMFTVGSLLITIDSPMYLCWAATVYCLWRHIETRALNPRTIVWLYAAGIACALGMIFKPVLIAIPICAAIAAVADLDIRRAFKTWHALFAALLIPLSQVPTILWNSHHGWVTFRHIATQGGFSGQGEEGSKFALALKHFGNFLGGQAGGMAGGMFVLLIIAVVIAWRRAAAMKPQTPAAQNPGASRAGWIFLLAFTLPLWAFYFLMNFWKGTEVNWPAAAYFTGMVLTAGVFVHGWNSANPPTRRRWRTWGTGVIALGILSSMIAMNLQLLYPLAARKLQPLAGTDRYTKSLFFPGKWDPAAKKLRGFQQRAAIVESAREQLRNETGQDPLIITTRYDTSSSLAFYLPGQPFVYCIMSQVGGRHSQYDLWPGLDQRDAAGSLRFAGRPALIIGLHNGPKDQRTIDTLLRPAFDRIEGPTTTPVVYHDIALYDVSILRCYNFKGLPTTHSTDY